MSLAHLENDSEQLDKLATRAKNAIGDAQRVAALKALWSSFLQLETWVFLTSCGCDTETASPFIGIIDGKPWALVFTNPQKAKEFAGLDPRFRNANGEILFLGIPKVQAIHWVLGLHQHGVAGIRINQGEFGWFSPLVNIPAILKDLEG